VRAQTNHMLRNSNVHRLRVELTRGAASPSASSPLKGAQPLEPAIAFQGPFETLLKLLLTL
jgi:hypothetical protein